MIRANTGIIASKKNAILPLDVLSASSYASYSTRKVRTAYAGNCIYMVRSGNSYQAIGFSGTDFNVGAATSFAAGASCGVYQWYDQSGNGRTVSGSANFASSPALYTNGSPINTPNGKPMLSSVEAGSQYLSAGYGITGTALTVVAVIGTDVGSGYRRNLSLNTNGAYDFQTNNGFMWYNQSGGVQVMRNSAEIYTGVGSTLAVLTTLWSGGTGSNYVNGNYVSSLSNANAFNIHNITLFTGWNGSAYSDYSTTRFAEIHIFASALSTTDRQLLERNMGAYYSITVA